MPAKLGFLAVAPPCLGHLEVGFRRNRGNKSASFCTELHAEFYHGYLSRLAQVAALRHELDGSGADFLQGGLKSVGHLLRDNFARASSSISTRTLLPSLRGYSIKRFTESPRCL
jgi:hypothetical protein